MKITVDLNLDIISQNWVASTLDTNGNGAVGNGKTQFEALVRLSVQLSDTPWLQFEESQNAAS